MLSTSQRAPGYRFQYHVPPTLSPASKHRTVKPACRNLWTAYIPAKPAPMTTASWSGGDSVIGVIHPLRAGRNVAGQPREHCLRHKHQYTADYSTSPPSRQGRFAPPSPSATSFHHQEISDVE